MRVVFLSPAFPPEMIQYTRGLAEIGAEVLGIGDTPRAALPAEVRPICTTISKFRASSTRTT